VTAKHPTPDAQTRDLTPWAVLVIQAALIGGLFAGNWPGLPPDWLLADHATSTPAGHLYATQQVIPVPRGYNVALVPHAPPQEDTP